jgi:MFS transporter, FLVCR family, MFS-domain-containing protein 7
MTFPRQFVLNLVAAMVWPWFGPISNNSPSFSLYSFIRTDFFSFSLAASQFGITLDQASWLGNVVGKAPRLSRFFLVPTPTSLPACIYIPTALLIPIFCARYGIRRCVGFSSFFLDLFLHISVV